MSLLVLVLYTYQLRATFFVFETHRKMQWARIFTSSVVVEPTHLKNMLAKFGFHFPKVWGDHNKSLKPPPKPTFG